MYGMDTVIGISFQTSYGTAFTGSMHWIPQLSEDLSLKKEQLISQAMRGVYDEGAHYEGLNSVEGGIEAEAHPVYVGALLKAVLGDPATVTSGSIYTHTFKPRTSDFDQYAAGRPCTILKKPSTSSSDSADQFYDMVGSELEISCAAGEFLKVRAGFVGGKHTFLTGAAVTANYATGDTLFTWDAASFSIGGSANADIAELSISLSEKLTSKHLFNGAKTPAKIKRDGRRTIEIAGTIVYDSQSEYLQFRSQSERELDVTFRTSSEIQSGYYETFRIRAPKMRYTDFPPTQNAAGQIEVGFSAKGVYSVSSATALQITLVNTKAGY